MKSTINTVNIELSLQEVQMLATELNHINQKSPEGSPEHKVMLNKLYQTLIPVIEKHKIVNVITKHSLKPIN